MKCPYCNCDSKSDTCTLCNTVIRVKEEKPKKSKVTYRIRPISKPRQKKLSKYGPERRKYLEENPDCKRCGKVATEVHHMLHRRGDMLNEKKYWLPLCNLCHTWVTEFSKQAIEQGFSLSRLKTE